MSDQQMDKSRRRFLTGAATVVGGVGVAFAIVPFVGFLRPSARAIAAGAPVEVDISKLEAGRRLEVEFRGRPVWLYRRTEEQIAGLEKVRERLRDPDSEQPQQPEYARNEYRSRDPELMVIVPVCTHLGCIPSFHPDIGARDWDGDWQGGYFCACHGSMFDLAGRVYRGVPAGRNMEIPRYKFITDDKVLVGEDEEGEGTVS